MTTDAMKKAVKKADSIYLNSSARVAKNFIKTIAEYILIAILILMLASYIDTGSVHNLFSMSDGMREMMNPGGFVFNSLIAFLPVVILSNLAIYFGSGSKARLGIGILKCVAVAAWFMTLVNSAGASLEIPSIAADQGLDSIEIGLSGIAKFMAFVFLVCIIIPIGEYIGAYKKRAEALERKESNYE